MIAAVLKDETDPTSRWIAERLWMGSVGNLSRCLFDFVIVTDHDFGNGPPWRIPKENWMLTQKKADEFTVNDRFVAIAGYEWTSYHSHLVH